MFEQQLDSFAVVEVGGIVQCCPSVGALGVDVDAHRLFEQTAQDLGLAISSGAVDDCSAVQVQYFWIGSSLEQ